MDDSKETEVIHIRSQKMWQHAEVLHKFKPDKISAWTGEVDTKSHPYQKGIWNWYLCVGKRKITFLQCNVTGCTIQTPGKAPCPETVSQKSKNNKTMFVYLCTFCFGLVFFYLFVFFVYLTLIWGFCLIFF